MFRQVMLPEQVRGRLYLHSMLGREEAFAEFLSEAERVHLGLVVCLASETEIQGRSPAYSTARSTRTLTFPVRDFPIEDYGVPSEEEMGAFEKLVSQVSGELRSGKVVLIHCKTGIGRTGTVATCVLLELGLDAATSRQRVRMAGSSAEEPAEKNLVAWYSSRLRRPMSAPLTPSSASDRLARESLVGLAVGDALGARFEGDTFDRARLESSFGHRPRAVVSPARKRIESGHFRSVPLAHWIAFRHLDDFDAAIRHAVACGGDADTLAAIVAARLGLDAIPTRWRQVVEPLPIQLQA